MKGSKTNAQDVPFLIYDHLEKGSPHPTDRHTIKLIEKIPEFEKKIKTIAVSLVKGCIHTIGFTEIGELPAFFLFKQQDTVKVQPGYQLINMHPILQIIGGAGTEGDYRTTVQKIIEPVHRLGYSDQAAILVVEGCYNKILKKHSVVVDGSKMEIKDFPKPLYVPKLLNFF